MMHPFDEHLVEQRVTYTLEHEGRFYVVENVPARVNEETGEQYFAPATVARLYEAILGGQPPRRLIETPVYDFGERAA
jgi:hypothetical protein